ncbi:hypothetical protein EON83_05305 [bacterium]|nr:MAG: hypothetical protein EON83_05305 [bacterium]
MNREEYEAKKTALIEEIDRAFGELRCDEEILEGIKERLQEHVLEVGEHWRDIPDDWLEREGHDLLFYLEARSFRFFIPAYLRWFLRFMDNDIYDLTFDIVRGVLTMYRDEEREDFLLLKYNLLSEAQNEIVACFLRFQCERMIFLYEQEEDPANDVFEGYRGNYGYKNTYYQFKWALDKYWGRFLGSEFVVGEFPYVAERRLWRQMWKVPDEEKRKVYEAKKRALIEEIERVFDRVERGDGVTLFESAVIDDYGDEEARAKARLLDNEARWQDVPDENIISHVESPLFMDAKGLHYYLPAYMRCYLRRVDSEIEGDSTNFFGPMNYLLSNTEGGPSSDIVELLSLEQKRTIARFIQFGHDEADFWMERRKIMPRSAEEDDEDYEDEEEETLEERLHKPIQQRLDAYWGQFL